MLFRQFTSVLIVFFLLSVSGRVAKAQSGVRDQKEELQRIRDEVAQGQKTLDSLKGLEGRVQKQITGFDKKISTNRRVVARLTKELKQVRSSIGQVEKNLSQRQQELDRSRRRFLGSVRQFYLSTRMAQQEFLIDPNQDLNEQRLVVYLASLASFESGQVDLASTYLADAISTKQQLVDERRKITSAKKSRETATALESTRKLRRQRELGKLQRKKHAETDRILTLHQAAREMERIIARIEDQQAKRRRSAPGREQAPSVLAGLKGQLPAPFNGKIVKVFGNAVDPVTKLKSFSPGISIKGKRGGPVRAVADGYTAYVGNLRGYGNFIIINHDDVYYTTYAGLGKLLTVQGQYLRAGGKIATSSDAGVVKFELRKGREPLDPMEWIRRDAF